MEIIRRSFKFLNCDMFKFLYKSMVRSHVESAVCVWHPYKLKDIAQIENVQRRATKMLPEMKTGWPAVLEFLELSLIFFCP